MKFILAIALLCMLLCAASCNELPEVPSERYDFGLSARGAPCLRKCSRPVGEAIGIYSCGVTARADLSDTDFCSPVAGQTIRGEQCLGGAGNCKPWAYGFHICVTAMPTKNIKGSGSADMCSPVGTATPVQKNFGYSARGNRCTSECSLEEYPQAFGIYRCKVQGLGDIGKGYEFCSPDDMTIRGVKCIEPCMPWEYSFYSCVTRYADGEVSGHGDLCSPPRSLIDEPIIPPPLPSSSE